MEQNNQRNSRKRLNSLILLVAFTAVMLIVSTYAWFSTQKNVTLGNLEGKVNVAEGLQISLDALNWKNEIDLSAEGILEYFAQTNSDYNLTDPAKILNLTRPYITTFDSTDAQAHTYHTNVIPTELLPASTIGSDAIGETDMALYRGENTSGIVLSDIHEIGSTGYTAEEKGYFAIDFFIQNSTATTKITNYNTAVTTYGADSAEAKAYEDVIKLFTSSSITLKTTGKETSGLQNTLRTAFVLYDNASTDGSDSTLDTNVLVNNAPNQTQILTGTTDQEIRDVAIWEPNASGSGYLSTDDSIKTTGYPAHVDTIYQNNNNVTFSSDDRTEFSIAATNIFTKTQAIPTYALTAASVDAEYTPTGATAAVAGIADIYDWDITDDGTAAGSTADDGIDDVTGLARQYTLQTTTDGVTTETDLVSAKDGTTTFSMAPGQYHKLRLYVWLEGQDVDCINWASLGGDLIIDVGLSKEGTTATGSGS